MAFTLLSSVPLTFPPSCTCANCSVNPVTSKSASVTLNNLGKVCGPDAGPGELAACEKLLAKVEGLLLAQQSPERAKAKRQRLDSPLDCQLYVTIFHGGPVCKKNTFIKLGDNETYDGPLNRLARACGGYQNLEADLDLEFGVVNGERMKLSCKGEKLGENSVYSCLDVVFLKHFDFTKGLAEKWESQAEFSGTLSITFKLNPEAFNLIHLGRGFTENQVHRKMLEDTESTGDVAIIAANGVKVKCHKILLVAQSGTFKTMFRSDRKGVRCNLLEMRDISERGVRALLAYLYCQDIKEPVASSRVAAELLIAANKYGIASLYETMKDVILVKEKEWITPAAALKLVSFGKTKAGDPVLKEIEKKALSLLESKSLNELKQCPEFREQLANPDNAIETIFNLLRSK